MDGLREGGVYSLPEVGELVAHAVFRGGYVLYTPQAWEFNGLHRYESDVNGGIHQNGRATGLVIGHLTDTGRTARSRTRSGAAMKASLDS